ncbi:MAG: lipoyl(octanoyl) transferase, partial [Flavobacteriales bacterium]|nr:lipoyl(octanoyl) transferase [Flavobacteriales bacterium]
MQHVKYIHLGLIDYKESWDYQESLFQALIDIKRVNRVREKEGDPLLKTQSKLIFCEHPHVFTLGKSGHLSHLLVNEEQLAAK